MLQLTAYPPESNLHEAIRIDGPCVIAVSQVRGRDVKILFDAPKEVAITRVRSNLVPKGDYAKKTCAQTRLDARKDSK